MRWASIVIVAIGTWIVLTLVGEIDRLASHGKVIQAVVDDLHVGRAKDHEAYTVSYIFRTEGYPYTGSVGVSEDQFAALSLGSKVNVTYLPGAPDIHRYGFVTRGDVVNAQLTGSLLVLLVALMPAGIALAIRHQAHQELDKLRNWRAVPAQIIRVEPTVSNEAATTKVTYRVPQPGGNALTEERSWPTRDNPTEGDFFSILVPSTGPVPKTSLTPAWALSLVEIAPEQVAEGTLSP